ncbi:MAG: DUF3786 domain-containing protein [Thermodesulfobacteriota bacterium]|nr:DUF3786 domain-containing protein [Thermodesulfobacteriota bacterium]
MTDNYARIVEDNLDRLYQSLPKDLAKNLAGKQNGERFTFDAFGEKCVIEPKRITLGEEEQTSVLGVLISLYALNARSDLCIPLPLKSFKEFPDSMPYAGAFTTHTEQLLVPHVGAIKEAEEKITKTLRGGKGPREAGGDFSFIVYPLPKIALCYIFYEADEDFPASVTCLYSNNAHEFMPIDGLADVGEYTSRKISGLIDK